MNFMLLKHTLKVVDVRKVDCYDIRLRTLLSTQDDDLMGRVFLDGLDDGFANAVRAASHCNFDHGEKNDLVMAKGE